MNSLCQAFLGILFTPVFLAIYFVPSSSFLVMRKISKPIKYQKSNSVISIHMMNFNMIKQTERFHTFYLLHENMDKFILTNIMRTFIA
ncbi:hypothetical protein [Oceanobacillus sp. AG]|uniref:hypothetical protein n=1 Tax=Oceanobacillus sp. AG TaxID=2681969 RepID=UPI0018DB919E|nr:hypothetical protein [Oceanobacillus sp. AG]